MGIRLSDCERKKLYFKFGGADLYLRYDMAALLKLEKSNIDLYKGIVIELLKRVAFRIGLESCIAETDIDEKYIYDVEAAMSADEIGKLVEEATLLSLPDPVVGAKPKPGSTDYVQLFALFCDIMGKPDELFWSSTVKEIIQRWDKYAEINGYKKPAEKVRRYEDVDA